MGQNGRLWGGGIRGGQFTKGKVQKKIVRQIFPLTPGPKVRLGGAFGGGWYLSVQLFGGSHPFRVHTEIGVPPVGQGLARGVARPLAPIPTIAAAAVVFIAGGLRSRAGRQKADVHRGQTPQPPPPLFEQNRWGTIEGRS